MRREELFLNLLGELIKTQRDIQKELQELKEHIKKHLY